MPTSRADKPGFRPGNFFGLGGLAVGNVADQAGVRLSSTTIAEDASSGSTVGVLSVGNLPGGVTVVSYEITADPDSKFAINGTNLETDTSLDYETATSHSVTIRATLSNAETTAAQAFTITVTNVVDEGGDSTSYVTTYLSMGQY